jgi:hypothetical protein
MRRLMYMLSIGLRMESSCNVYTHVITLTDIYKYPRGMLKGGGGWLAFNTRLGDMISMRILLTVLHGRTP